MPSSLISPSELDYIIRGVDDNLRADGRGRLDYREVILETGLISQANGSARCRLSKGTDVLVGVKVEIGSIEIDGTDEEVAAIEAKRGRIVCNVECSPIASQQFAGRGADDINNELTQLVDRVLNGPQGGLNLEKLCIIPGEECWIVYIDALVLDYGGNILDIIFTTIRAALHNTRVPKTVIEEDKEVEISDDVEEWERIEGWELVPISVTLNKIGTRHIVDATVLEELATKAKLSVMVNKNSKICGIQKIGGGSIEHSLLNEMLQTGRSLGQNLIHNLDKMLQKEEEINAKRKIGFFASA
ncbi:10713_t:CDS:2 [Diversispora eburnea]|uniref:Ribosomal RNA-processing protein 42 n=1 Tax=Diversispora eburnea TaxID=1213867 RepID=A0A9N8YJR2_9GLOM|nr:10713_t:CDS:2 [Diversispora eburnea]